MVPVDLLFPDLNVLAPLRDPVPDHVGYENPRYPPCRKPTEGYPLLQRLDGSVCLEHRNLADSRHIEIEPYDTPGTEKGNDGTGSRSLQDPPSNFEQRLVNKIGDMPEVFVK